MSACGFPLYWKGCYQGSDLWCDDAYSHPAKMSVPLAFRIMEHLRELGLLKEKQTILDPMCGIATTGVVAGALGLPFIGIELEPKFVELSKQNKEYAERRLYKKFDWQIIQGDSRRLSELLNERGLVAVTSPPYAETVSTGMSGIDWSKGKREDGTPRDLSKEPAYEKQPGKGLPYRYSENKENIGNLPDRPLATIMSPPYEDIEILPPGQDPDRVRAIRQRGERYSYRGEEMIDYAPVKGCKNPDTYGEICVKCGKCGRYDKRFKCINCGYIEGKKPISVYRDWGEVEFYDVFSAPICPKCRPFFKAEDRTNFKEDIERYGFSISHVIMPCRLKEFGVRK